MRLVVAIALDEPWSVVSRLVAYGAYADGLGIEVVFKTLQPEGLNAVIAFDAFTPTIDAPLADLSALEPRVDDVVIFSAPKVHHTVKAQYGRMRPRFVHLIQSALAASAVGECGYGYRLFQKPIERVVISSHVERTIRRLIGDGPQMTRVDVSYDLLPFAHKPRADASFDVAINAFDGEFTRRVVDTARTRGFHHELHAVSATSSVAERASAYKSSTVLLAAPHAGEGLAQPVFEAMAAGCAVIMTHCEALSTLPEGVEVAGVVQPGDLEGMVRALLALRDTSREALAQRRAAAQRALAATNVGQEQVGAQALLAGLMAEDPSEATV